MHEVDAADAHVEHAHAVRKRLPFELLGDDDAEAVVAAQHVADARHEYAHVQQDRGVDAIGELEERLRRYPAERYPVQRATALFHLGTLLAAAEPERARAALEESVALFGEAGLEVERAKARNALGAALRELGDDRGAAVEFGAAAEALGDAPLERAAALFNLALVTPIAERMPRLREAQRVFVEHRAFSAAAAAARELGTALLETDVDAAVAAFHESKELADRAGDGAALGAAANALGLALLAAGRTDTAVAELRTAAAAHPRAVRQREHAAAKANLALAYEQAGDVTRACLVARQALGVPDVPAAVARQAQETLARLGDGGDGLAGVLDADDGVALLRDELARWADAADDELRRSAEAWTLAEPPDDLAELMLGALLELPPELMDRVLGALAAAGARDQLERVAPRFHAPQELRVRDTLARLQR